MLQVLGELCEVIVEPLRDRIVLGLLQASLVCSQHQISCCHCQCSFFFGVNFHTVATKKNLGQSVQRVLFEKVCKSCHNLRGKSQKLPYLENKLLEVARTKHDPKNILCLLTFSQIWLIPVVDDHQSTYLMN